MKKKSSRSRAGDRKRKSRRKKEGKSRRVKAQARKQSSPPSDPSPRDLSGYANPKKPWCPGCEAHTKVAVKGGKKTCLSCSGTRVYTPAYKKLAAIFHASAVVFCLLLTAWVDLFFFLSLFFTWTGFQAFCRQQEWVEWAEKDAARRVKKKLRENEQEKDEEDERAKDHQPASPPPVPPPLPPDSDYDDD